MSCHEVRAPTRSVSARDAPRILITGATGLLGRQILKEICDTPWIVRGLSRTRHCSRSLKCDLTQDGEVRKQIEDFRPHFVVHCAAERRPDVVQKEPERARKLNVDATGSLAAVCNEIGACLLYISTDYVFDGTQPPYQEDAVPNPLNMYGKYKLEGERLVLQYDGHCVLRVPLLFGPLEYLEESSVTDLYASILNGRLKKVDHLQKRYPTSACDVAKVVQAMAEMHRAVIASLSPSSDRHRLKGIYHWQNDECLTKYDMVTVIADICGLDVSDIQPDYVVPKAARPENSRLTCTKLEGVLGGSLARFRTQFRESLKRALLPFMVRASFQKSLGSAVKLIQKEELLAVFEILAPGQFPRQALEETFIAAADPEVADMVDYEHFIRWIFQ